MATNRYISQGVKSEQNLYEDLTIESLKIYGQDVYYLPRTIVNEDKILGEDVPSRFTSAYKVEMYIENVDGFDGEGDLFTKFGVEIRDQATFVLARKRWAQTVSKVDNQINGIRPREGDLIYLPLSNKLFEIMRVEHEAPFYQLQNLVVFKLQTELFEYSDEDLDTGITSIDNIETEYAYTYTLTLNDSGQSGTFVVGETASMTLSSGVVMSGEVARWTDSDNKLRLIHIGADDGNYHEFVADLAITGATSSATGTVTLVTEEGLVKASSTVVEQNTDFDAILDFLDFSESNPFGDVRD